MKRAFSLCSKDLLPSTVSWQHRSFATFLSTRPCHKGATSMNSTLGSVLLALAILSGLWLVQGLVAAQVPEQQIISDAAEALGGRDRILAVRTLLVEGQGKDFSFGQGARPDEMG